jgi:pseudouridine-5'-phosphate glycosidase
MRAEDLDRLVATPAVAKLNPGNLALHLARGAHGSMTVAATRIAAHRAGAEETCDRALASALAAAEHDGVRGRDVTPFLLERMRLLTGGESVEANRVLLLDNAGLAARLAVALATP